MGKSTRYLESSATPEEDSYGYRVEWDNVMNTAWDQIVNKEGIINYGPGSRDIVGFDNAWDTYKDLSRDPYYTGVRLIRIDSNGNEEIYASK